MSIISCDLYPDFYKMVQANLTFIKFKSWLASNYYNFSDNTLYYKTVHFIYLNGVYCGKPESVPISYKSINPTIFIDINNHISRLFRLYLIDTHFNSSIEICSWSDKWPDNMFDKYQIHDFHINLEKIEKLIIYAKLINAMLIADGVAPLRYTN